MWSGAWMVDEDDDVIVVDDVVVVDDDDDDDDDERGDGGRQCRESSHASNTRPDSHSAPRGKLSCWDDSESEPTTDGADALATTLLVAACGVFAAFEGQSRAHSSSVSLSTRLQCLSKALK